MRIRPALPCCCSCRQAMATELKKQKPLGGGKGSPDSPSFLHLHLSGLPSLPAPGLVQPKRLTPPRPSPDLTWLWNGLHGVLGAGPQQNHSGNGKNAYQPKGQPSDPISINMPSPSPSSSQSQDGSEVPSTQPQAWHPLLSDWM